VAALPTFSSVQVAALYIPRQLRDSGTEMAMRCSAAPAAGQQGV
jgi:hypothetical protein